MAHYTDAVEITSSWSDLEAELDALMASQLNIQNQSGGRVAFCVSTTEPTTNSYTIAEHLDVVVKPAAIANLWVKCLDRLNGKLSIEVV